MAPQVKSVLSKIMVCRTAILDGHVYRCPSCDARINVYNSCGDRHCPQCAGASRADWMDKASEVILPGVNYFQLVFTLPERLSGLILGHRRELYGLLFHSAWRSLDRLLRQTGQFQPAALMVLHTWNQELGHHPHVHAIVPGGGPALDGQTWVTSQHPTQRTRRKPFLVDNVELGCLFRKKFLAGLRRLIRGGKLRLDGDWARLRDVPQLQAWLEELEGTDWNVFIQGPPKGTSDPEDVLKYLARYLTGGPISDRRIVRDEAGTVTFSARSKDKKKGNPPVKIELAGHEFLRRWTLHILPKSFTKSRSYGGFHVVQRQAYLAQCRALLRAAGQSPDAPSESPPQPKSGDSGEPSLPKCPRCQIEMICIRESPRPSWKVVFQRRSYSSHNILLPVHGLNRHYVPDD